MVAVINERDLFVEAIVTYPKKDIYYENCNHSLCPETPT